MEFRNLTELKKDSRQVLQYNCCLDFETAEHSSAAPSGILVDIILDKPNFSWGFIRSGERRRRIEKKLEKYKQFSQGGSFLSHQTRCQASCYM